MVAGATRNEEISRCKIENYIASYIYSAGGFSRELSRDN